MYSHTEEFKNVTLLGRSIFYCFPVFAEGLALSNFSRRSQRRFKSCSDITRQFSNEESGTYEFPRNNSVKDNMIDSLKEKISLQNDEIENLTAVLQQTLKEFSGLTNSVLEISEILNPVTPDEEENHESCQSKVALIKVKDVIERLKKSSSVFTKDYGFVTDSSACSNKFELDPKLKNSFLKRLSYVFNDHSLNIDQMITRKNVDFERLDLKNLVRDGIPFELREKLWKYILKRRSYGPCDEPQSNRYSKLCFSEISEDISRQIDIDVSRCLTVNVAFQNPAKMEQLKRILLSFAKLHPEIGYCQSFGKIAAFLSLVLNEKDAFRLFEHAITKLMPKGYYVSPMTASRRDQFVLKALVKLKLPILANHLEDLDVDLESITFNWFHSLFAGCFSLNVMLMFWDSFLLEGRKILFRVSYAMLSYLQEDLISLQDSTDVLLFLSHLEKVKFDIRRLRKHAFHAINPLPWKLIEDLECKFEYQM